MYEGTGALKLSEFEEGKENENKEYNDEKCVDILNDDEYMEMYKKAYEEDGKIIDIHT